MPLSEQEQRLLDEMERNLYQNDADDVTSMSALRGRATSVAIAIGILAAAAGVALLVVGVVVGQPLVGVLGFAVMFGGTLFAISPPARFRVLEAPEEPTSRGSAGGSRIHP